MTDLWCVQLPSGGVHEVTLDQLDDAFQRGFIDGNTWVFVPASLRWMTLGAILEEPEPARPAPSRGYELPPRVQASPPRTYEPPYSVRPTSIDLEDEAPDLDRFKRKGPRRVISLLAIVGALWGAAVVRPDLRGAVTAQVESRLEGFRGSQALRAAGSRLGGLHGWQPLRAAESRLGGLHVWQTIKAAAGRPAPATEPAPEVQGAATPAPTASSATLPIASAPPVTQVPSAIPAAAVLHRGPSPSQPQAGKARPKASPSQPPKSGGAGARRASPASVSPFTTGGNKYDPLNSDL